ncbi:hypothetical protein Bpfe_029678, partial [Biomphalaria pfeifferi]
QELKENNGAPIYDNLRIVLTSVRTKSQDFLETLDFSPQTDIWIKTPDLA